MTQPKNPDELRQALVAKIHRLQQQGKNADRQITELALMMMGQQKRLLRTLSNRRFGKRKARALRKKSGELVFQEAKRKWFEGLEL